MGQGVATSTTVVGNCAVVAVVRNVITICKLAARATR